MSKERMCSRFYCDRRGGRFCCTDCPRAYRCENRCLNHPRRCRLVEQGKEAPPREDRD